MQCLRRPVGGIRFPGTGVPGDGEKPEAGAGNQTVLQEQPVFSINKPALQPHGVRISNFQNYFRRYEIEELQRTGNGSVPAQSLTYSSAHEPG